MQPAVAGSVRPVFRPVRVLVPLLLALSVVGCRARADVLVAVEPDGSGTVTVTATLDPDAVADARIDVVGPREHEHRPASPRPCVCRDNDKIFAFSTCLFLLSVPYLWVIALFSVFAVGIGLILTARSSNVWQKA